MKKFEKKHLHEENKFFLLKRNAISFPKILIWVPKKMCIFSFYVIFKLVKLGY